MNVDLRALDLVGLEWDPEKGHYPYSLPFVISAVTIDLTHFSGGYQLVHRALEITH